MIRFTAVLLLAAACSSNRPSPAPSPAIVAQAGAQALDENARLGVTEYDVVIRNGRVLDGMGNPWILADVAIRDGRFVRIGKVDGPGVREIDAKGLYVSPGWIDMMDQSGSVLPQNGLAENKLRQGVRTAIGGEGGFPVSASRIPEYFATLEQRGISINFGATTAPLRHGWRCSIRSTVRRRLQSWTVCAPAWTRRCARERWG